MKCLTAAWLYIAFSLSFQTSDDVNGSDMDSEMGSENDEINDIDSDKLDASHREILEKLKRQELEEREEIERELKEAQKQQRPDLTLKPQDLRNKDSKDREQENSRDNTPSPQTEIKTQRPLGLLAQHGLTTKSHHSHAAGLAGLALLTGGSGGGDPAKLSPVDSKERPIGMEPKIRADPLDLKDSIVKAEKEREQREKDQERDRERKREHDRDRDRERLPPLGFPLPPPPGLLDFPHPAFLDSCGFGAPPVSHPGSPSSPSTPASTPVPQDKDVGSVGSSTPGHHWTFEEQFKQVVIKLKR